jgi:hypothetical protein
MQTYERLVRRLVIALETAKLDYAFTGALATSFYGLPRTTIDVDVMVQVCGETMRSKLVNALAHAGIRVDEREIDKAMASDYGIAEFTDRKTAYSVDVILLTSELKKKLEPSREFKLFFKRLTI